MLSFAGVIGSTADVTETVSLTLRKLIIVGVGFIVTALVKFSKLIIQSKQFFTIFTNHKAGVIVYYQHFPWFRKYDILQMHPNIKEHFGIKIDF
ncbi:Protein of unknown function [Cotesia congregata]|uniref:Uncharacterized protein n=1 Tax=Cotesia congregata TaxID=51543 RepID=A0A8J2ML89_COTCN|nr:Protein of unknown function [Cotesia congregata]